MLKKELAKIILELEENLKLNQENLNSLKDKLENMPENNFVFEANAGKNYLIDVDGEINEIETTCEETLLNYNVFTNKEYAEKIAYKQWFERKLLAYKDENEDRVEWGEEFAPKYYAYVSCFKIVRKYEDDDEEDCYDEYEPNEIIVNLCYHNERNMGIYFVSKQLLEKHIWDHREEWNKYLRICKELD